MIIINGKELIIEEFPNGEVLIKQDNVEECLINRGDTINITFKFEKNEDLIYLYLIKNHLEAEYSNSPVRLRIVYMPYSRMDRTEGSTVFTLKYISQMINKMNFSRVEVLEPHSDVTMALLDRSVQSNTTACLFSIIANTNNFDNENDYVYFADGGADKRYSKQIKAKNILVGNKKRDFRTGEITSLEVIGDIKHKNFRVFMVDDLCSYGGTFIKGAEELRKLGATEVYLIITHCEKSILKGKLPISNLIDMVYCTNSIIDIEDVAKEPKIEVTMDVLT